MQKALESETTDTGKMEGGCLREFTRFLEKVVSAAYKQAHGCTRHALGSHSSVCQPPFRSLFLQDPDHRWADLQRAQLAEGQSVWCCKDCTGIINEDKDATYQEIRTKAEAAAEPLPVGLKAETKDQVPSLEASAALTIVRLAFSASRAPTP